MKFDEEIENTKKKRISYLARLIIIGADPGPMTKEEIDLVTEEIRKQKKKDWDLEDRLEDLRHKRIMNCLSTNDAKEKANEEFKLACEEPDLYGEIIDHDIDSIIDCIPTHKK